MKKTICKMQKIAFFGRLKIRILSALFPAFPLQKFLHPRVNAPQNANLRQKRYENFEKCGSTSKGNFLQKMKRGQRYLPF